MVFDGLVANTRPGACDVDPPVVNKGPRSTTVTSMPPGGQLVGERSPNDAGTHDDELRSHSATHLHYVP